MVAESMKVSSLFVWASHFCFTLFVFISILDRGSAAEEHKSTSDYKVAPFPDQKALATGYDSHGGPEKLFMYAHQPDKKQYEFGFKRGNDHHSIERYEKGGPNHEFKGKVRWHDSKGGHGEHYWDYNHAPKHKDEHGAYDHSQDYGEEGHNSHGHDGYGHNSHGQHGHSYGTDGHSVYTDHGGYHTHAIPDVIIAAANKNAIKHKTRFPPSNQNLPKVSNSKLFKKSGMEKKEVILDKKPFIEPKTPMKKQNAPGSAKSPTNLDFINLTTPPPTITKINMTDPDEDPATKVVLKYEKTRSSYRKKTPEPTNDLFIEQTVPQTPPPADTNQDWSQSNYYPKLAYDLDTGRVYDENTGIWYKLIKISK